MRTSIPGRARAPRARARRGAGLPASPRASREAGTVLIDVLVALMIASSALLLSLGNIAYAGHIAARNRDRVVEFISASSNEAAHRGLVFGKGSNLP